MLVAHFISLADNVFELYAVVVAVVVVVAVPESLVSTSSTLIIINLMRVMKFIIGDDGLCFGWWCLII